MSTSEPAYPPPAAGAPTELANFVAAIEKIHEEHRVMFIQAGDEKIYSYGGGGYVVTFSEVIFAGLVEVETPNGALRIEPDAEGRLAVTMTSGPETDAGALLADAVAGLERYYAKRYW